ncbi:hypothetical protein GGF31_003426 [Allomyces arbusculus]|nr:hypothetical protein GGF31_003426 [Allomyces arbusculus]
MAVESIFDYTRAMLQGYADEDLAQHTCLVNDICGILKEIVKEYHPIDTLGITDYVNNLQERVFSIRCKRLDPFISKCIDTFVGQVNESIEDLESKSYNELFKSAIDVYQTIEVIKHHVHSKVPEEYVEYVCSELEPFFFDGFHDVQDSIFGLLQHPDYYMPIEMLKYKFLNIIESLEEPSESLEYI